MGCGGSERWRLEEQRRDEPGHAVLCHPDRTAQPGMGMWGHVLPLSGSRMDGVARQLPGGGEAGTKRELPGPSFLHLHPNLWAVGPRKGHGVTCCVPAGAATIPPRRYRRAVFLQGDGPGRRALAPAGLSRGCEVGLGAAGMGRMGAQPPAGARQEDQPQASAASRSALPRNLPRHLSRHAGARSSLAGGGVGGSGSHPDLPTLPAGDPSPGGARLGGLTPTPGLFPRCGECRELGWESGGGSPHSWGCAPGAGDTGEGQHWGKGGARCPWAGMGELCGCAGL